LFLLSIVCSFDEQGLRLVLDSLNHYRLVKREEYRFQHLVQTLAEPSSNEQDLKVKAHILMLINALLSSTAETDDIMYVVLRKEFNNLMNFTKLMSSKFYAVAKGRKIGNQKQLKN
jgi:hypothetical protein